jgi:hypothetical protein
MITLPSAFRPRYPEADSPRLPQSCSRFEKPVVSVHFDNEMNIMKASAILLLCIVYAAACNSEASARLEISAEAKSFLDSEPNAAPLPETQAEPLALIASTPSSAAPCDPNYDPCVPVDSDVDCLGGSGNGPSYVRGPVRVIRRDIYRLDHDRDGIGCEN